MYLLTNFFKSSVRDDVIPRRGTGTEGHPGTEDGTKTLRRVESREAIGKG